MFSFITGGRKERFELKAQPKDPCVTETSSPRGCAVFRFDNGAVLFLNIIHSSQLKTDVPPNAFHSIDLLREFDQSLLCTLRKDFLQNHYFWARKSTNLSPSDLKKYYDLAYSHTTNNDIGSFEADESAILNAFRICEQKALLLADPNLKIAPSKE